MKKQHDFNSRSLPRIGGFVVAVLVLVMGSQAYGQAPTIELSASKTTGDPGDEITFDWKVTGHGSSVNRVPGTHVVFIRARWGHDNSGNTNPHVLNYQAFQPRRCRMEGRGHCQI